MEFYIYKASYYCGPCGKEIMASLPTPPDKDDEYTYDSDDYPKGPYLASQTEADYPMSCEVCELPLGNMLTEYGKGDLL